MIHVINRAPFKLVILTRQVSAIYPVDYFCPTSFKVIAMKFSKPFDLNIYIYICAHMQILRFAMKLNLPLVPTVMQYYEPPIVYMMGEMDIRYMSNKDISSLVQPPGNYNISWK